MKVLFLSHSGFFIEYQECVLIFDYYEGTIPEISSEKQIYVFASHAHYDHFQKKIFEWVRDYQNITYILSDDITEKGSADRIISVAPRQVICVDDLKIQTFRSTDEGVAFLVHVKDKVIYHAGDLNWWHWEEESDAYNEMMRRKYQNEIGKIPSEKIDLAFVPLDPRQGEQDFWGLDYFMKHTDTRYVFPMHMWGKYDVYDKLMKNPKTIEYKNRVMRITGPQQIFELEDEA